MRRSDTLSRMTRGKSVLSLSDLDKKTATREGINVILQEKCAWKQLVQEKKDGII